MKLTEMNRQLFKAAGSRVLPQLHSCWLTPQYAFLSAGRMNPIFQVRYHQLLVMYLPHHKYVSTSIGDLMGSKDHSFPSFIFLAKVLNCVMKKKY